MRIIVGLWPQNLEIDQRFGYVGGEEEVVIAVDATGVKATNGREWMRKKRKDYIKIHIAVDTKTKQVLSVEVNDDRTNDGDNFVSLMKRAKKKAKVKKVLVDSECDYHKNFNFLTKDGMEAGIKVKGF